jgi:hypothetical protein
MRGKFRIDRAKLEVTVAHFRVTWPPTGLPYSAIPRLSSNFVLLIALNFWRGCDIW